MILAPNPTHLLHSTSNIYDQRAMVEQAPYSWKYLARLSLVKPAVKRKLETESRKAGAKDEAA